LSALAAIFLGCVCICIGWFWGILHPLAANIYLFFRSDSFSRPSQVSRWCYCNGSGLIIRASSHFKALFSLGQEKDILVWEIFENSLDSEVYQYVEKAWSLTANQIFALLVRLNDQDFVLQIVYEDLKKLYRIELVPLTIFREEETKESTDIMLLKDEYGAYSHVWSHVPFIVFLWRSGKDSGIVYGNPQYQKLYKYIALREVKHAQLFQESLLHQLATKALDKKTPVAEKVERLVGQERRSFELWAFEYREGLCWFVAVDITLHLVARESLAKQRRTIEKTLKVMPQGVAIFNDDQRLASFNGHFLGMFQFDESWLLTHPPVDEVLDVLREKRFLPEVVNFVAYKHQIKAFFENPGRQPHEEFVYLPNERTLRIVLSSYPLKGCLMLCEDMTEKLHFKRKHKEIDSVLHAVTHQSSDGIIILSSDFKINFVNQTFLKLVSLVNPVGDLISPQGKNIFDLLEEWRRCFYYSFHLQLFKTILKQCVSARLSQKGVLFLKNGQVWHTEYHVLLNGEHVLKFHNVSTVYELQEVKAESTRLFLVERYLFLARIRQIRQRIQPQELAIEHMDDTDKPKDMVHFHNTKWVSARFLQQAFRDLQKALLEDKSILRDTFFLSDVLDEALLLFDEWMTEKNLSLQLLGMFDRKIVMNRILFGRFLCRALGYIFYEAAEGGLVTLSLSQTSKGMILTFSAQVSRRSQTSRADLLADCFRLWSFQLLKRFAALAGCEFRGRTCQSNHMRFRCLFSKQSVEPEATYIPHAESESFGELSRRQRRNTA